MRLGAFRLLAGFAGSLFFGSAQLVSVRVTAPHPGLVARITGSGITLVNGQQIRAGDGFVIVSTPADVLVDPKVGDFYFQLEPDTAWVTVDVQAGATSMNASSYNVVVAYEGTGLMVAGVPQRKPESP